MMEPPRLTNPNEEPYIPYKELGRYQKQAVNSLQRTVKAKAIKNRWGLDKLVRDGDLGVRLLIACQGNCLDILSIDSDSSVRAEVARHGYAVDELAHDTDPEVRSAVASAGYCHDVLVDDSDSWVKLTVANQGYGWDKLIDDESLVDAYLDGNPVPLSAIIKGELERRGTDIDTWKKWNPEKCSTSPAQKNRLKVDKLGIDNTDNYIDEVMLG